MIGKELKRYHWTIFRELKRNTQEDSNVSGKHWQNDGLLYQYNRHSTLMTAYRHIKDPKFLHYVIREKSQVYEALKHFFAKPASSQ